MPLLSVFIEDSLAAFSQRKAEGPGSDAIDLRFWSPAVVVLGRTQDSRYHPPSKCFAEANAWPRVASSFPGFSYNLSNSSSSKSCSKTSSPLQGLPQPLLCGWATFQIKHQAHCITIIYLHICLPEASLRKTTTLFIFVFLGLYRYLLNEKINRWIKYTEVSQKNFTLKAVISI